MKKDNLSHIKNIIWIFLKYQIVTKVILSAIIFPVFSLVVHYLIDSTGRTNLSSGDYLTFFMSFHGILLILSALIIVFILIALDINSFIITSTLLRDNIINIKVKDIFYLTFKSIPLFIKPSGIIIAIYISLIPPLIGVGVTISPMTNFQIPNFVTSVIYGDTLYYGIYVAFLIIFSIITFMAIFTFHYIIITHEDIVPAIKKSFALVKNHYKKLFIDLLKISAILISIATLIGIIIIFMGNFHIRYSSYKTHIITLSLFIAEFLSLATLLSVPLTIYKITTVFFEYNSYDKNKIISKINYTPNKKKKRVKNYKRVYLSFIFIVISLLNLLLGFVASKFFDNIFKSENNNIAIIAHRGSGNLGAENTLDGLDEIIKLGASWSEIDVQRTKDGYYIINHDNTFMRLSNVQNTAQEMTLEEVKKLKVKNEFNPSKPAQQVATLEEFLDASKGRIGLFIELKGETADKKMVDDIVDLVNKKNMKREVVLLSLDYSLINYIEEKYPDFDSGYLYFFSIGNPRNLKGDYLIMEESEATEQKIHDIKNAGKKAVIWTVNSNAAIKKFVALDIDGIITDYVLDVKQGIQDRRNRTDLEIIVDEFLSFDYS